MAKPNFDWDNYLAKASYKEVFGNSPDLSSRRPPSLYNPDRTLLYLPSVDLDVATDDFAELKLMLNAVIENFQRHQRSNTHRAVAIARIDCIELCGLLQVCAPDPEPYLDPDLLLDGSPST